MNERSKKIYSWIIAVLLVLSVATSFLPSIQVKADEQISIAISDFDFFDKVQSVNDVFTLELYNQGLQDNTSLSDSIKYNTAAASTIFANNDTNLITNTDTILSDLKNHNLIFNDYGSESQTKTDLHDFISDPEDFYKYYIFGNSPASSSPVLYIFYSRSEINGCVVNGSYGTYYIKETSASPVYRLTLSGIDSDQSKDYRDVVVYNASDVPTKVLDNIFIAYSSFPIYFSYYERGYTGETYTNYDSPSKVVDAVLVNNESSDFLIDRRTLFSNFVPDGYNVNSDPISQENVGVYDFDFYPSGDVTSGLLNIDNLQLSAKTSEMENVHLYALITYNFQCNGFYYEYGTNVGLVENYILNNMNTKPSRFNIRNVNILETTIDLDDTTYQTFSSRSVMKDTGPTDGEKYSIYIEDGIPRSIDMFDLYGISNYCQFIASTQTTPKTKVANISSSVVTTFQVSCSIKIDYNDGQVSKTLATNTYDYLTGNNYKYGLTSTDNNTPADDMPSTVTDGLQWINNGGFGNGVGGNTVNGGSNSNSNSNSNNPTFTNNNNPSINIENNNTGGGFGTPETQNGMIEEIWSIWSSWQFLKDITQEVAENDFIQFVFSGDLYQLPLMNIVIPAVAVIVFISIASTVIRFIRGN